MCSLTHFRGNSIILPTVGPSFLKYGILPVMPKPGSQANQEGKSYHHLAAQSLAGAISLGRKWWDPCRSTRLAGAVMCQKLKQKGKLSTRKFKGWQKQPKLEGIISSVHIIEAGCTLPHFIAVTGHGCWGFTNISPRRNEARRFCAFPLWW